MKTRSYDDIVVKENEMSKSTNGELKIYFDKEVSEEE